MKIPGQKSAVLNIRQLVAAVLCTVLLTAAAVSAQEEGETTLVARFRQANLAYSEGNFTGALEGYLELIDKSGPSAELYYNAGCAALKAGELGQAVINFHRASRLAPRDEDIRANLKFVSALTRKEEAEDSGANVVFALLSDLVFGLSTREAGILQIIFLLVFSTGAVFLAAGSAGALRKAALIVSTAGLLLLLANSAVLGAHIYRYSHLIEAVIIQDEAEALSGPGGDNTRVLVIPEGTVVRLREGRGNWALVSLPSGRSGWLKRTAIEEI